MALLEESDLDIIEDNEIKAHLPSGEEETESKVLPPSVASDDVELMGDDYGMLQASLKKHVSGKEIWRWLIGIVLVLLVLESLLAKRFGDYTR